MRCLSFFTLLSALMAVAPGALQAEGRKFLINRSGWPLEVVLTVRAGENIHQDAGEKRLHLDASGSTVVEYGSAADIDLNAIELIGPDGCSMKQRVTRKDGTVDRLFNRNGAITFRKVSCLPISVPEP